MTSDDSLALQTALRDRELELLRKIETLVMERERLRDALKRIRDACGEFENSPHSSDESSAAFRGLRYIAQGALRITI